MTEAGLIIIAVIAVAIYILKKTYENGPSDHHTTGYVTLTPKQAKERLDKEKDIIVLDVRTPEEYEKGHLPNDILIPLTELETEAAKKLPDKDVPIFIYCARGNRSRAAAKKLIFLGYTEVFNIGGINEWPYTIIKS